MKKLKKIKKPFTRKLSEFELAYLEELVKYDKVLNTTMLISQNQQEINTTGRGVRASKILTRQTIIAMSLKNILPYPTKSKHHEEDLWDICSISSLARNIMEGYISIYYFGTEEVTEQDAELRFFLFQYHRNREWYQIRRKFGEKEDDLSDFKNVLEEQKKNIREHPFLSQLTDIQKNKVSQGHEIYKTKSDFENENTLCHGLVKNYQLLSNLVHPLPFSIERMDNEKGRGIGHKTDINYCIIALIIARKYLAASTIAFTDFLNEELRKKFKNVLDDIRPFQSEET
ncbi:MAG: hypothetical protein IH852_12395 [Bacteroidetes bacterium]|nr:hypothetical protein [Bacteroidota bacterium]